METGGVQRRLRAGLRAHGFISQDFFVRTQISVFGRTYTFSRNPTQGFINETPDPLTWALSFISVIAVINAASDANCVRRSSRHRLDIEIQTDDQKMCQALFDL